jgi:toxin ParE1/3/4
MGVVYRRPAARRDLIEHYIYLMEHAGEAVADRFLDQARASFNDLARQPRIGAPLALSRTALRPLRKWRINDCDNYLIFYLPRIDGVSIVRVLYAAQDWYRLLGLNS